MISSWFSSLGSNLVERSKNPFLGTFAFVWLARNWELLFALFNFDDSHTLESKISFLTDRIQYDAFWTELFANVMWTFFVLVLTYFLINVARFITNMFENRLTPLIYSISSEGKIVTLDKYKVKVKEIEILEERIKKERELRLSAEAEIDRIEEKERKKLIEEAQLENMPSDEEMENHIQEKNIAEAEVKGETKMPEKEAKAVVRILELINKGQGNDFEHVIKSSFAEKQIDIGSYLDIISILIELDVIEKVSDNVDFGTYRVTNFGKVVVEKVRY